MSEQRSKALKAAFPHTIPVLAGFLFLGFAYGVLMKSKGYAAGWSILMSLFAFAGSAQYAAIIALTTVFHPLNAFALSLIVNARHIFYSISMLETYKDMGKIKPYLVFGLCDETFSIVSSAKPPQGVEAKPFYFFITFLNHCYWVIGTALGGLFGAVISLDFKGLDFVLTALFVTIFVGQWKVQSNRAPAAIGVLCAVACLLLFGENRFIIPAMLLMIGIITLFQKFPPLTKETVKGGEK